MLHVSYDTLNQHLALLEVVEKSFTGQMPFLMHNQQCCTTNGAFPSSHVLACL